jgi:hypothetical protein
MSHGLEPVVGGGELRGVTEVVGAAVRRRPHEDLADLAGRHVGALGVEHPHLGAALAPPDAALVQQPLVATEGGDADGLGHPVGHQDALGADEPGPAVHERRRHRRRALEDPVEARQVAAIDVGAVGDALQHRGRGGEAGDAVALDGVEGRGGVELLEHHEAVAGEQVVERGEGVDVVHRRQHQHPLRAGHRPELGHHRGAEDLGVDRRHGAHDDLRRPGGAAAADAHHPGRDHLGQVDDVVVGGRPEPVQVVVAELEPGADHLAELRHLPVGEVPAHRHRRGADPPRGEGGDDELGRVAEAERHPVAEADALGCDGRRHLAGPAVELGRRQHALGAVDADVDVEHVVGLLGGELPQPLVEADRFHRCFLHASPRSRRRRADRSAM